MPQPWGLLILLALAVAIVCLWGGFLTALQALRPARKGFAWALATGRAKDPSELGLRFEDVNYASGARHASPAWSVSGGSARADAPIVVLLHGWGRSRWDSLTRVGPFLDSCSQLALIDLPAHGEHPGSFSGLGVREPERVLEAMEELSRQYPNRSFILAGHSMGAGVAMRAAILAQRADNRQARQSQTAPKKEMPDSNTRSNSTLAIAGVVAFAPYSTLQTPLRARLSLQQLPVWPLAPIALMILRILGRMDRPLELDARELRAPLLVMAGDGDPISPIDEARRIATAAMRGGLVVLPFQQHDDLRSGDAVQFDEAIGAFLRSITSPSAAGCASS